MDVVSITLDVCKTISHLLSIHLPPMKKSPSLFCALPSRLIAATILLSSLDSASAINLYWDPNGAVPGTGGTGTWNFNTTPSWSASGSGGSNVNWTSSADTAYFGGIEGVVTVSNSNGNVVAKEIGITRGGYSFEGDKITIDTGGNTSALTLNPTSNSTADITFGNEIEFLRSGTSSNEHFNITLAPNYYTGKVIFNGDISVRVTSTAPRAYTNLQISNASASTMVFNGRFLPITGTDEYLAMRFGESSSANSNAIYEVNGDNSTFDGVAIGVFAGIVLMGHEKAFGTATLNVGNSNSTATPPSATLLTNGALTVANNVYLSGNNSYTAAKRTLGGYTDDESEFSGTINANNFHLTLTAAVDGEVEFSNLIYNGLSATKEGEGTVRFTRAAGNTYGGSTTIKAGTLLVENTTLSATGAGAVSVQNGALGGTGRVSGAVTVGDGTGTAGTASIFAGTLGTIETLETGALSLSNTDAAFRFDLNSTTQTADRIIVTGALTLGNGLALFAGNDLSTAILDEDFQFVLMTATGGVSGSFAGLAEGATYTVGNNAYRISYGVDVANSVSLTVIPEPDTALLMAFGLGIVLFYRRRHSMAG